MKKIFAKIGLSILAGLLITGCNDNDDNEINTGNGGANQDVNKFVWAGLNSWYNWQGEQPLLADSYKGTAAYNNYISTYDPIDFFDALTLSSKDRFSWIVEDYVALENSFAGNYQSYGFNYGLSLISSGSKDVMGYVQYVIPNTPAAAAGIKRGDMFISINGQKLTTSNYSTLLNSSTATFGLADINSSGALVSNGKTVTMSLADINENPVFLDRVITTTNGTKVGYLVYNSFTSNYHQELNDAIGRLKAGGATQFVLDLRYNGGGSVETSTYLASMITGQFTNQTYCKLVFNSKPQDYNDAYTFMDTMNVYDKNDNVVSNNTAINHLNMTKLYVLVSNGTASASEMIINGLRPYIDVQLIGTDTYGKNVGSITLYDIPNNDFLRNGANTPNPNHKYAMQPIVFSIFNKNDWNDYGNGFVPNTTVNEWSYLGNIKPLGDINEPLLNTALRAIDPTQPAPSARLKTLNISVTPFGSSKDLRPHSQEMYIRHLK